jgi:RNase adaptor protein for sRNA GlmZ degradation
LINTTGKTIIIRSFGFKFPEMIPEPPADNAGILYYVCDLRAVTPALWPKTQGSGEEQDVYEKIITRKEVASFLTKESANLDRQLQDLSGSNIFHVMELNYGCAGGYQRSVVIARWAFNKITTWGWKNQWDCQINCVWRSVKLKYL